MTPFPQQLEDKKKGCNLKFSLEHPFRIVTCSCGQLCNPCRAEIAILKQAIAEIKKKDEVINFYAETLKETNEKHKVEMQKQRQYFERILNRIIGKLEDGRNQREEIIDYCKDKKQQLNQPKTEE